MSAAGTERAAERLRGSLMVAGTSSDAGKSVICAGICRWLSRRGVSVAPFKAQNMALNSGVTAGGAEIGRAQLAQAAAAGVEPEAAMNPILIKPSGERRSQVMLMGRPLTSVDARGYQALKPELLEHVLGALEDLRARFDVVVCEGAGSPAEINLRENDLANMGLARAAGLPTVLVGDIDRGGVLASMFGTVALLDPEDQALLAGFLVNKFRGDPGILAPGIETLRDLTGRPTLGVLPWIRGLWLDVEDSLALEGPREGPSPPIGADGLEVAVVRLRWMSNFTDFDALAAEPGVSVRFTRSAPELRRADLVIVPGTKATVEDLGSLREHGLDRVLAERVAAGDPILGICGGYQMLGREISDEVESGAGVVPGLGLLPVETEFAAEKVLGHTAGAAPALGGARASGYEIHHGRVRRTGAEELFVTAHGEPEGCRLGSILATSWHGVLEGDALRRELLARVAEARGLRFVPGDAAFATVRERRLDALGDLIEEHADADALIELIADGAPADLPTVLAGVPAWSSS